MIPVHRRLPFAALFLSSGAALLVYILSGISLPATLAIIVLGATLLGAWVWHRATASERAGLRQSLRAGGVAGAVAVAAYDSSRYLLVKVAGLAFWPFDVFTLFGQALVGSGAPEPVTTLAGVAFHVTNGVGFALAYSIWLGRRGVWAGMAWALALEGLMVSIYPGWLGLKALNEFVQVSVVGHFVYGGVLGFTARRLLLRGEGARHGSG